MSGQFVAGPVGLEGQHCAAVEPRPLTGHSQLEQTHASLLKLLRRHMLPEGAARGNYEPLRPHHERYLI